MHKKQIDWLYRQLPQLIEKGVLSEETAQNLRNYYGQEDMATGKNLFLSIFAGTGFLLIGLGIILILAHNWYDLARSVRFLISVGVLFSAQVLAGWVLWFKSDRPALRQGAAVFLVIMIGASISLVGQTYHLADDMDAFLLSWSILSLPVVYLMDSVLSALVYLGLITAWVGQTSVSIGQKQLIWFLFLLILPFYKIWGEKKVLCAGGDISGWFLAVCFFSSFFLVFSSEIYTLKIFIYNALFSFIYLATVRLSKIYPVWQTWQSPFKIISLAGITVIAFFCSNESLWDNVFYELKHRQDIFGSGNYTALIVAGILLALTCWQAFLHFRASPKGQLIWAGSVALVGAGYIWLYFVASGYIKSSGLISMALAVIFSGYILAVSVRLIIRGIKEANLTILNAGMIILAALIIIKFFDSNFGFVTKGLTFISVGASFLAANLVVVKRFKRKKGEV